MKRRAKGLIAALSGIGALAAGATSTAAHQGHGMGMMGPGTMMAQTDETGDDTAQQGPASGSGQGPGMMQGMGQGYGYGPGPGMMGPGMMGQGYGPGPGMMGPGMMGQGYGPGPGMMMGPGMMGQGYGPGQGMMMGPGMMGQGYGPGPGMMMGPGMMGQGYGPGPGMMGPGMMMGRGQTGYGPCMQGQHATLDKDLEPDDVRARLERWLEMQGNDRLKLGTIEAVDDDTITAEIVTVDDSLVRKLSVDRHTGWMQPAE